MKYLPRNSRIPKSRIPEQKLEFLGKITRNSRIPKPCVIPQLDWRISSQRIPKFRLKFRHYRNSVIVEISSLRGRILDFSGVLGAAAPKGLGRNPYKICELG